MTSTSTPDETTRIAFVCVRNAGRSQMAAAFARREREERGLGDRVDVLTGGTHPADEVHPGVVDAMAAVGIDLADRTPREITTEELRSADYLATMGCSTLDLDAVGPDTHIRPWDLEDPEGLPPDRVREIRDDVERQVTNLFDEVDEP